MTAAPERRDLQRAPGRRFVLGAALAVLLLACAPLTVDAYSIVLLTDVVVFALFAASLHFLMGPGGMVSFGHAAYLGIGAYAAALLARSVPMEVALIAAPFAAAIGALVCGWFSVRLSGVYLAMLTLAFAQIAWSVVFQWDSVTGGSNGLVGIRPATWLENRNAYYLLTLLVAAVAFAALWRITFSPFGYALRAARDSVLRAEAVGIDVRRVQWQAFVVAGSLAGVAGALYAFSKGSISPDVLSIPRSVDALVMVLLGGVQTLLGPIVGAALLTWVQDSVARHTDYWRAVVGAIVLLLVLAFPGGIVGAFGALWQMLPGKRR